MGKIKCIFFDFDGVFLDSYNPNRKVTNFLSRYVGGKKDLPLVPDMKKVIENVAGEYMLCIISSSGTATIRSFLEAHGLRSYFTDIVGYELAAGKAKKMKHIMFEHGLASEQCVFITDTVADIKEAHQAQVRVLAVSWGHDPAHELVEADPEAIIRQPAEISAWLAHAKQCK